MPASSTANRRVLIIHARALELGKWEREPEGGAYGALLCRRATVNRRISLEKEKEEGHATRRRTLTRFGVVRIVFPIDDRFK